MSVKYLSLVNQSLLINQNDTIWRANNKNLLSTFFGANRSTLSNKPYESMQVHNKSGYIFSFVFMFLIVVMGIIGCVIYSANATQIPSHVYLKYQRANSYTNNNQQEANPNDWMKKNSFLNFFGIFFSIYFFNNLLSLSFFFSCVCVAFLHLKNLVVSGENNKKKKKKKKIKEKEKEWSNVH